MTREEIEHAYDKAVEWANEDYRTTVLRLSRVRDIQIKESENDPQRVRVVAWILSDFEYDVKAAARAWEQDIQCAERERDEALAALAAEEEVR